MSAPPIPPGAQPNTPEQMALLQRVADAISSALEGSDTAAFAVLVADVDGNIRTAAGACASSGGGTERAEEMALAMANLHLNGPAVLRAAMERSLKMPRSWQPKGKKP